MIPLKDIKSTFIRDIKRPLTWLVLSAVIIILCIDFFNRIHTPLRDSNGSSEQSDIVGIPGITATDFYSQKSFEWRQQHVIGVEEEALPEVIVPDPEPLQDLMVGSQELGDHLVRIRAIFTSSSTGRRVALAELQDINDRDIAFTHLQQGDSVGDFMITSIDGQLVKFKNEDGLEVAVSVFDWHPDFDAQIELNDGEGEQPKREEFDEVF